MNILPISSTQITEIANNYQIEPSRLLNISLNLSPIDHNLKKVDKTLVKRYEYFEVKI